MSIQSIKTTIVKAAVTTGQAVKSAAVWLGRTIKSGFNNYLIPAIKKIWSYIAPLLRAVFSFLRTGFGLGAVVALGGLILHEVAERNFTGEEGTAARRVINFIAAGLSLEQAILLQPMVEHL